MKEVITFEQAMDALRDWHRLEVDSCAELIAQELKDEDVSGEGAREWLYERINELCDGHQHIIYTVMAKAVLLVSDNEDAYEEEIGDAGSASVEARACMAMAADIRERLGRMGIDINDPKPDEGADEDGVNE